MKTDKNTTTDQRPPVCQAVRAVGIVKPKFNPQHAAFDKPSLDIRGTGFWLKTEHQFVTCAHVVGDLVSRPIESAGRLVMGGNRFPYVRATIQVLDIQHDLALLSIHASEDEIEKQVATGLELTRQETTVSERVAYAGFPFGNILLNQNHSPTYAEGNIGNDELNELSPKQIQVSGQVAGGFSGAPIVLANNPQCVVAILSNSPSEEVGHANIFRGISWRHLGALCMLANS